MARWECYRCSYEVDTENPPEECPNCHYSVSFWLSHADEARVLTLSDFVRRDLLRLDGNESVWEAAKFMRANDTENVLVLIDGVPTGMVTEKDILNRVAAEDMQASKVLLRKIMSTPFFSAPSETPVNEALKMMAARHIRRLVVTEGGEPIGIVSHRSILGGSFRSASQRDRPPD